MRYRGLIRSIACALLTMLVFSAGIWYSAAWLRARGPVILLIMACSVYLSLGIVTADGRFSARVRGAVLLFLVSSALFWILITPATAYSAWFLLVDRGVPQGSVSFVFLLVAWVGASYLAVAFLRHPLLCVMNLAAWFTLLASIGMQSPQLLLLFLCIVVCSSVVSYRSSLNGRLTYGVVLVALIALSALAGSTSVWFAVPRGSRLIDTRVSPMLRAAAIRIWPEFPLLAGLSGSGEGFSEVNLAGTPLLTDSPVLELSSSSGQAEYIRSTIFDTYVDGFWTTAIRDVHRFTTLASGRLLPSWMAGPNDTLHEEALDPGARTIQVRADYVEGIPYPVDAPVVELPREYRPDLESGSQWVPRLVFTATDEYRVHRLAAPEARQELNDTHRAVYTAVPEQFRRAFEGIVDGDSGDAWQTLSNIRGFLRRDATYALVRLDAPDGRDPLEYFVLDDRSGFCIHFASAAVVLARMHGMPARYVTGFLVPPSSSGEPVTVRGIHAHAWAEVWLDGRWQVFETTPGPGHLTEPGTDSTDRISTDPLTRRQLSAFGMAPDQVVEREDTDLPVRAVIAAILGFFVLLGGILLSSRYRGVWKAGIDRGSSVEFRSSYHSSSPLRRKTRRQLRRIVRSSGVAHPSRVGWTGWAESPVARRSVSERAKRRARVVARLAHRSFFSPHELTERDLRYLKRVRFRDPT
ncbi:MAG: hypothetical protein EA383_05800 [Spirochaetaceae bacterium]|nr:MAG: hypothetical protein EA383_05800 [Spirochaetaceae bacterium]